MPRPPPTTPPLARQDKGKAKPRQDEARTTDENGNKNEEEGKKTRHLSEYKNVMLNNME